MSLNILFFNREKELSASSFEVFHILVSCFLCGQFPSSWGDDAIAERFEVQTHLKFSEKIFSSAQRLLLPVLINKDVRRHMKVLLAKPLTPLCWRTLILIPNPQSADTGQISAMFTE